MSESESNATNLTVAKNDSVEDGPKKRQWTTAREIAWQKCLDGRKEYLKTKTEMQQREAEEKTLKQKVKEEMIRKKIRAEIEAEMKRNEKESDSDTDESDDEPSEQKPKKARIEVKEDFSDTESEQDTELVNRKRKKVKAQAPKKSEGGGASFARFAFV